MTLFFRPSPSRLSPGRNTVFVSVERIVQHLASFPLWGIKREHGPIRSPNCPCAMATTRNKAKQPNRKHQKPKPKQNQTKHQTKKTEKPHHRSGQVSSMRIAATYVLTIEPCMYRSNTEDRKITNARRPGRVQKVLITLRKPGVPPARIPEITTRRPQGTTGTPIPR